METVDEWYLISKADIVGLGGGNLYKKYGQQILEWKIIVIRGLISFLRRFYPMRNWSEELMIKLSGKTKLQLYLAKNLWVCFIFQFLNVKGAFP